MQTQSRSTRNLNSPEGPRRGRDLSATAIAIGASLILAPLILLAVFTKIGVAILLGVAVLLGFSVWVWRRGFVFLELVALSVHFDGLGFGPIRLGRGVAIAIVVVIFIKLLQGWRPPAISPKFWVPTWLFTLYASLSGFWSVSGMGWIFNMALFGLGLAYAIVPALFADSATKIQQALRAYWVGGLFGSVIGLLALALGTRSWGFSGDPNMYAMMQASLIPITLYYRRLAVTSRAQLIYTGVFALNLIGCLSSGSRAGLISGGVAFVFSMVLKPGLNMPQRLRIGVWSAAAAVAGFFGSFIVNVALAERSFNDRGAGRLDLWIATIDLLERAPIFGHGFGQVRKLIPDALLVTPGSQLLDDPRVDVAAHNTWLEIMGDLGIIGVLMFAVIFIVPVIGFLTPQWKSARTLSTVLFVMMMPLYVSFMFLSLLNNKMAWTLVGLAAAMQVPAAMSRWKNPPQEPSAASTELAVIGESEPQQQLVPVRSVQVDRDLLKQERLMASTGGDYIDSPEFARWDLSTSRPIRIAAVSFVGLAIVASVVASFIFPTRHVATAGVYIPRPDTPETYEWVQFDLDRLQGILTLPMSIPYAVELINASGIDLEPQEVVDGMMVTRPDKGAFIEISFRHTDLASVDATRDHLIPALDSLIASARQYSQDSTGQEVRPMEPGESPDFTGDLYTPIPAAAVLTEDGKSPIVYALIGASTSILLVLGLIGMGQFKPRVSPHDDLGSYTGIPTRAVIGKFRSRRRGLLRRLFGAFRSTQPTQGEVLGQDDVVAQYRHIATAVAVSAQDSDIVYSSPEMVENSAVVAAPRVVIAPPTASWSASEFALGVASALTAHYERVVLIDADYQRPYLSWKLRKFGAGLSNVAIGEQQLSDVLFPLEDTELPDLSKRLVADHRGSVRFIPAGRGKDDRSPHVPIDVLNQIDRSVAVVVLAPAQSSPIPTHDLFEWADDIMVTCVQGRSVTYEVEDTAATVQLFGTGTFGTVVLPA